MTKRAQFCLIIFILLTLSRMSFAQEGTWTQKKDMPTARAGASASVVNGKIYVIGGTSGDRALSTVEEYNPSTDTWTTKNNIPTARAFHSASVVNGRIYAIGGWDEDNVLSTVEEYDPIADTWAPKPDMPTARHCLSASAVDGKIYVVGGGESESVLVLSTVEQYDPATDIWMKKADLSFSRQCVSTSVVNGKIYAIGGWNGSPMPWVEEYDPVTGMWVKKKSMRTARTRLSTSVVNGKIYAVGGWAAGPGVVSTVEVYDPATDTWTKMEDMPTRIIDLCSSAVNGYIYAIGGTQTAVSDFPFPAISVVEVYDTGEGIRVTSVSREEGLVIGGEDITIYGRQFPPDANVTIGGNPIAQLKVINDKLINGVTPKGIEGRWDIIIDAPSIDFRVLAGEFLYKPLSNVEITGIEPNNGKQDGGDVRSISGSGFHSGAEVTIGGNLATDVVVETFTVITVKVPPGTEGPKDVVVTNPDGQKDTLQDGYIYNPKPVIDEITPEYGGPLAGGTEMIITGSNFMQGVKVYIGEELVTSVDRRSHKELHLKTPKGTEGTKAVRVVNPDEQEDIWEAGFTYNKAPRISSVEPDAGALKGGTRITITGDYFMEYPDVLIGDSEGRVVHRSSTKIIAITPPSDEGAKNVKVRNRDGQEYTRRNAFTYNPAPGIISVTPNNGRLDGTMITIYGSGFLPEAKALISTGTSALLALQSVQVLNSTTITAIMPPGKPGPRDIFVQNTDKQISRMLENGFTYNPLPTIVSITPNYGSSAGGTKVIIEGTGFIQGANVMIGGKPATTQVKDDTTIEAITPSNPPGVWDVRVVNPDTQEGVKSKGFISLGEIAYNYPNPFRASQGTTFRYVTDDPVQSITVKIFNLAGVPIDVVQHMDSNEVKWQNTEVHVGLYVYLMEVEPENGNIKQFRGMLEVYK